MNQELLDQTVYSFIDQFAWDEADKSLSVPIKIYAGYQTRNAPPGIDYIIFTLTSVEQRERKMVGFRSDGTSGKMIAANMSYNFYQIMCGGVKGRSRIHRLRQAFTSTLGATWMRGYTKDDIYGGAAPIDTGSVIDMSEEGKQGQWEFCYACDFTIAARMEIEVDQDWAEHIDPKIILAGVDRKIQ